MFEQPGTETCLGLSWKEWHALGYGLFDAYGRYNEAQLGPEEKANVAEKRHYFWAGNLAGVLSRAVIAGGFVFLMTGDAQTAAVAAVPLVVGDQVLAYTRKG